MKRNKIKKGLRQQGNITNLAGKTLGKSFSMVNSDARNKYQPDLETLLEISKILEVDLKDLITDENERV